MTKFGHFPGEGPSDEAVREMELDLYRERQYKERRDELLRVAATVLPWSRDHHPTLQGAVADAIEAAKALIRAVEANS